MKKEITNGGNLTFIDFELTKRNENFAVTMFASFAIRKSDSKVYSKYYHVAIVNLKDDFKTRVIDAKSLKDVFNIYEVLGVMV